MSDLNGALEATHAAVADLMVRADQSAAVWTVPRAPGKWSPSQLTEHVARALEESANVANRHPSKFPALPRFLRPVVRRLFFKRILRRQVFPKARTNRAFNPEQGPPSADAARERLAQALHKFDQACRATAERGDVIDSSIFGMVSVTDYARFQALHVRHHCRQLPDPHSSPRG